MELRAGDQAASWTALGLSEPAMWAAPFCHPARGPAPRIPQGSWWGGEMTSPREPSCQGHVVTDLWRRREFPGHPSWQGFSW